MEIPTSAPTNPLIVVFARAPELGRVKTRLAATMGDARALELYRWLGARVARELTESVSSWRVLVAFTPDDRGAEVRGWLGDRAELGAQGAGDLGARMGRAVSQGLSRGHDAVILVGTDCAAVTAERVAEAVSALAGCDAVMGAARDGGYYLLGLRRAAPVFDAMTWSTDTVAAETRRRLREAGFSLRDLAVETDVDESSDLGSLAHYADAPAWVREF